MATHLTTTARMALKAIMASELSLGSAVAELTKPFDDALTSGAGLDSADLVWWDSRSVGSGSPDDLDLTGGLTSVFGTPLSFARLKSVLVHNKSGTASAVLLVGDHPTAAFAGCFGDAGDIVKVGPGGVLFLWNPSAAGYPVISGTADVLRIAAASGTIEYDVVLVGASA